MDPVVKTVPGDLPLKRIRRHITGRGQRFFIATAPGLENLCIDELKGLPGPQNASIVGTGGIEFDGRLTDGYAANLHLRTANRILMRMAAFKATGFRQLERKLADLPWELYLNPGSWIKVHVSSRHSRLYHTEAVSECLHESIRKRIPLNPAATTSGQVPCGLFVRAADDRFILSIDSSGDPLYKRGIKTHPGAAPVRETLAAAVLKWSGYDPGKPLVDPMCGTGTFSLEAALIAKKIPAGWFRDFAFMQWPGYHPNPWGYLKKRAHGGMVQVQRPLIFASDSSPAAGERLTGCVNRAGLSDAVAVSCRDFFDFSPKDVTDQTGLIVLNPPYGHRIGSRRQSRSLFAAVCEKLKTTYPGWSFALMAPEETFIDQRSLEGRRIPLHHGGIRLKLLIGKVASYVGS